MPLGDGDPAEIGVFRLLGRLGVGGMGIVYLAECPKRTLVAVKLVHQQLAYSSEFRARFAAEIAAARRLPAFCTAPVREEGEYKGRPYLVTDYLPGIPLSRLVTQGGPLEPGRLHNVAIGAAAALAAIHQLRLIHRDMKPSNLIVTPGGVRVIDFGIVKALDGSGGETTTGVVMASPGWASPEQLAGEPLSSAVDIFGWGSVIAYAGTGSHPYGNDHPVTRAWQIMYGRPSLDGLPETLAGLVAATLDRDPSGRPTATALLLALATDGTLPPPAPVEPPAPPRRGLRRLAQR